MGLITMYHAQIIIVHGAKQLVFINVIYYARLLEDNFSQHTSLRFSVLYQKLFPCEVANSSFLNVSVFNFFADQWNRKSHPLTKREFGVWELFIADGEFGMETVKHGSMYKVL